MGHQLRTRVPPLRRTMRPPIWLLVLAAAICIVVSFWSVWSELPSSLRYATALAFLAVLALALFAFLYLSEHGLASLTPAPIQRALVDMSVLDVFEQVWQSGDVIDAAALLFLRMDRDQTESVLRRLPSSLQSALTTRGLANFAPAPIRSLLLPPAARRRSIEVLPCEEAVHGQLFNSASTSTVGRRHQSRLPELLVDVTNRRLRALLAHVLQRHCNSGPLSRLSPASLRAVVMVSAFAIAIHLYSSSRGRRIARSALEASVFLSSLFTLASSLLVMRFRRQRQQPQSRPVASVLDGSVWRELLSSRRVIAGGATVATIIIAYSQRRRLSNAILARRWR